jgi:thymidine phosphorylase
LVGPEDLGLPEPAFHRFAESAGAFVTVTPAAPPGSLDAVRPKIRGRSLSADEIGAIVDDLTHYRYSDMEIAAFLIGGQFYGKRGAAGAVEVNGARGHAAYMERLDKHCIGGIPENRTSMIVVPIVAAHGLTLSKTSSREITWPAGTADTMEVLARVDLGVDQMKEVVAAYHGCLVWDGYVNLSPTDDRTQRFIPVRRLVNVLSESYSVNASTES